MKIIQVSRACSRNEYDSILKNDSVKTNQSILKFSGVMNQGFLDNGVEVEVFSQRPVNRKNCAYKYLAAKNEVDSGIRYHYCRIFNFRVIGKIYIILASFFYFLFKKKEKDQYIIVDTYALTLLLGTLVACKLRRFPCIGLVTDLPSISTHNAESKVKLKNKLNDYLIGRCDGLVLLTEQMNQIINPKKKPYIVVEGFASDTMRYETNELKDKCQPRKIVYTGALDVKYGLKMLVEGFLRAQIENCQLVIYGGGEYADELIHISSMNPSVVYGGIKTNDYVVSEQIHATLLVNPRFTSYEYNKYCFPGKNMEYMASGTPTLTTDLPGMPDEYRPYVFILQDESVEGMADMLHRILSLPAQELHDKGLCAKKWMLEEKGAAKQTKRILHFLENNMSEKNRGKL